MIVLSVTNSENVRGMQIEIQEDRKTVYKPYGTITETIYSEVSSIVGKDNQYFTDTFNPMYRPTYFAGKSVEVRNKSSHGLVIGEANCLCYDRRLDLSNYRELSGIDTVIECSMAPIVNDERGYVNSVTVTNSQVPNIPIEYVKEGGILKGIVIECQSLSYSEFTPIVDSRIIGAKGLPPGMKLEYGKIKGSPNKAGEYKGHLTLATGKVIGLTINVARVRRMF